MKHVALAILLSLSTLTAAARPADACGGYGSRVRRETATGQWPSIERGDGSVTLELHYPRFGIKSDRLYAIHLRVVDDQKLRDLEKQIARDKWATLVDVVEVRPGTWRVVGWTKRA